jgi:hypothetical protein
MHVNTSVSYMSLEITSKLEITILSHIWMDKSGQHSIFPAGPISKSRLYYKEIWCIENKTIQLNYFGLCYLYLLGFDS